MSIESTIVSDVAGAAGSVATSYIKVAEYAAMAGIVVLSGYLGWHFNGLRYEAKIDAQQVAQQNNTIAAEKAVITKEEKAATITNEVSNAYEKSVNAIDDRYDGLLLTPDPAVNDLPSIPGGASGHHAAACPDKLSTDRKKATALLMKQADIQTQRLIACQSWVKGQGGH